MCFQSLFWFGFGPNSGKLNAVSMFCLALVSKITHVFNVWLAFLMKCSWNRMPLDVFYALFPPTYPWKSLRVPEFHAKEIPHDEPSESKRCMAASPRAEDDRVCKYKGLRPTVLHHLHASSFATTRHTDVSEACGRQRLTEKLLWQHGNTSF